MVPKSCPAGAAVKKSGIAPPVFFALDRLSAAYWLTSLLVLSNGFLTWLTLQLDPMFYGLGFCGAMLITSIIGIAILRRAFRTLEYQMFMLQA